MKELKLARKYLEKAIKAQMKDKNILMSQFCKQMGYYLKNLADKEKNIKEKRRYESEAKIMRNFAYIFKKIKPKVCGTCGGEGVCWLLTPCPDCDEGKKVKEIGKRVTKNLRDNKIKAEARTQASAEVVK